jgi:hypothetical protein
MIGVSQVRGKVVALVALPAGAAVLALLVLVVPLVVPPLMVVALASLVRIGRTLLDRIMVAGVVALGATAILGLLYSVWPWGLDPLAVSLVGWTGLWCLAVVTRRHPSLPRPSAPDLAIPVAALSTVLAGAEVVRADGFAGRLALLMIGEDTSRHFAWFRGIADAGSYIFLARDQLADTVIPGSEIYPQGWHLTVALLDGFAGGSTGQVAADHFLVWSILTQAYLVLATTWLGLVALDRRPGAWHVLGAAVVSCCLVLGGDLFRFLLVGHPAQGLGLALCVAGAAVVALSSRDRPGAAPREAMVSLAVVLVGISFAYYVYLPAFGLLLVGWLWHRRRDVRRAPLLLGLTAAAATALAAVMPLQGLDQAVDSGALATSDNGSPVVLSLLVRGGIVVAASCVGGTWREPGWRWAAFAALSFLGCGLALALAGGNGYYVHKIWHVPVALAAGLVSSLVLDVEVRSGRWRAWRTRVALLAVTASAVVGAGVSPWGAGVFTDSNYGTNALGIWRADYPTWGAAAPVVLAAHEATPPGDDVPTWVVHVEPFTGYLINLYYQALRDTSGSMYDVQYVDTFTEPDRLQRQLDAARGRVRLLASSPEAEALAEWVKARQRRPGRITIDTLPPPPGD